MIFAKVTVRIPLSYINGDEGIGEGKILRFVLHRISVNREEEEEARFD